MHRQQSTFGVSAAAMIERHLAFILRRFKVEAKDGPVHLASLAHADAGLELLVEAGAPREEQLEYAAIQLGYVAMNFKRPQKRAPLYSEREREEYAQVIYWAARALIPDNAVREAEREGWDARKMAHECEVTLRMATVRIKRWKAERRERAPQLGEVVEIRGSVPAASPEYKVDEYGIRYEPSRRHKGLMVPIPEDHARWAKMISKKYGGKGRF